jgi:hypothetical protein
MLKRFSLNASANVFSGLVSAIYQLSITSLAFAAWDGAKFAVWGLAMSVSSMAPILSANLSNVVTRRLIESRHSSADHEVPVILASARLLGRWLTFFSLAVLFCAGSLLQRKVEIEELTAGTFLLLLVILLSTNSWALLHQVRFGQHFADERNWLPAITVAAARGGGLLGLSLALVFRRDDLLVCAIGLGVGTWAALFAVNLALPAPLGTMPVMVRPSIRQVHGEIRKSLRVLSGFAIGTFSILAVQYSIPPLVAVISPHQFSAFYVASAINMTAVGTLGAAMSALLAPFSRWNAIGDIRGIKYLALYGPMFCVGLSLVVLAFCWFALSHILEILGVRPTDIRDIRFFLALLGFHSIVRTAAAGFATYVSSAGTGTKIAAPLIIELVLAFAIAFPLGVAFGTSALVLGLVFSSLVGSLYSSRTLVSLRLAANISTRKAMFSLLAAQTLGSAVWLLIVGASIWSGTLPSYL